MGQGGVYRHGRAGEGVEKGQLVGVKGGPGDAGVGLAIEPIPQEGTAQGCHMDPQLMGAAGMGQQLHQG